MVAREPEPEPERQVHAQCIGADRSIMIMDEAEDDCECTICWHGCLLQRRQHHARVIGADIRPHGSTESGKVQRARKPSQVQSTEHGAQHASLRACMTAG